MSNINVIKRQIREALMRLYGEDAFLFERNYGQGVGERCLTFRLAHYLQLQFDSYHVDCDFNSSWEIIYDEKGVPIEIMERHGKIIPNPDGSTTGRFVDIIIHRRILGGSNDFLCFEIKKWNNCSSGNIAKDYNNLEVMTSQYGYKYGFHVIIGRDRENARWSIFHGGQKIADNELVFV
ncbi:MAG: hypothetical protein PHH49_04935 [Candidatus Omnitrophica bacterium]|nr:hypothetical protein [Candidatus Omnitrophota bacterium]MDD5488290.1 hypothetical protein [Candidatus Omnitrophota bacterium]